MLDQTLGSCLEFGARAQGRSQWAIAADSVGTAGFDDTATQEDNYGV
jgi:hypothetical protein